MKKISVIVTVYNKEPYLKKCLDSILVGLSDAHELIIVDDCSTDNSKKILEQYKDKNIKKIYNEVNKGVSKSRNIAIQNSTGEYFVQIDADDYIAPDYFERLIKLIKENKEPDLISIYLNKVDKDGNLIKKCDKPIFDKTQGFEALTKFIISKATFVHPPGFVYKTSYWKDKNFNYLTDTHHEDYGLTPLVIMKAESVVSTDYVAYFIVASENSIMRTNNDLKKEERKSIDLIGNTRKLLDEFSSKDIPKKYRRIFCNFAVDTAIRKKNDLPSSLQKKYNNLLKKEKLYKYIYISSVKDLIKKVIIFINFDLYLKLTR